MVAKKGTRKKKARTTTAGTQLARKRAEARLVHINKELRPLARQVSRLRPDPGNARVHDERNLETIRASLELHGQQTPIVLEADGKTVKKGSGTLLAARALGWKWIAAIRFDRNPDIAAAYGLADNRTAELATWDGDALGAILKHYRDTEPDSPAIPGWTADEIALLLPGAQETTDDVTPAPPAKPVSVIGEVYELGPHRVMCGDATDSAQIKALLAGSQAALIVTSPPYDNAEEYEAGKSRAEWETLISNVCNRWAPSLLAGGIFAVNVGNRIGRNNIGYCMAALEAEGLVFVRRVVWKKPDGAGIPTHGNTHKRPIGLNWQPMMITEELLVYSQGERRKPIEDTIFDTRLFSDYYTDCWQFSGISSDIKQGHPAAFPVLLPQLVCSFMSVPGDVVADPMAGSGSTLIAAERTGRVARVMDIEPRYVDVIRQRYANFVKDPAYSPTGTLTDGVA